MLKKTCIFSNKPFFVDTNIIEYYVNKVPSVLKFIQNPEHKFFFTETVLSEWLIPEKGLGSFGRVSPELLHNLKELDKGKDYDIEEHFGTVSKLYSKFFLTRANEYYKYLDSDRKFNKVLSHDLDKYFTYRHSGISLTEKYFALGKLREQWNVVFSEEMYSEKGQFPLKDEKIKKFEKDLFIVFEASKTCCYDISTASAPLVTNNLDLIRTFLRDEKRRAILENTINLSGFEHLIDVEKWGDIAGRF